MIRTIAADPEFLDSVIVIFEKPFSGTFSQPFYNVMAVIAARSCFLL